MEIKSYIVPAYFVQWDGTNDEDILSLLQNVYDGMGETCTPVITDEDPKTLRLTVDGWDNNYYEYTLNSYVGINKDGSALTSFVIFDPILFEASYKELA